MVSDKKKLEEEFKSYRYSLSCKRSEFIVSFETYLNFQFKLWDKYGSDDFFTGKLNYVDEEKLRVLRISYLICKREYENALRKLYNFTIVQKELLADIGYINTNCTLEELRSGIKSLKRSYRPSKV